MKKERTEKELDAAKLRKHAKKKKSNFRRPESWRYKRLNKSWRRPRGCDNKMRLKVKGWPKSPKIGYRSPRKTRTFHPSGYKEVLVQNISHLHNVDPEKQAIRIAHTVGTKKRMEILTIARERGIHILNPRERIEFAEEEMEEEIAEEEIEKQMKGEVKEDER
ncbi:MAG: 50S ribosomal protein L32e [Thermoproteota archaeon]|nr:50S ribosomal protein L32e [Thermoproteota archaeon]